MAAENLAAAMDAVMTESNKPVVAIERQHSEKQAAAAAHTGEKQSKIPRVGSRGASARAAADKENARA